MRRVQFVMLGLLALLAACGSNDNDRKPAAEKPAAAPAAETSGWTPDPMASRDPAAGAAADPAMADDKPRPLMQVQVVLDRLGFAPGVIDGKEGISTTNAVKGFQEARDMAVTGKLDDTVKAALKQWSNIPATRVVTIPENFAAGPFHMVPEKPEDQAKMPALSYESLDEKLAERFHTTVAVLKELNPVKPGTAATTSAEPAKAASAPATIPAPGPPSYFQPGQQIRVPNVGVDAIDPAEVDDRGWLQTLAMLGVGTGQPKANKIVVDKSAGTLQAFDKSGKLLAQFTATMGSKRDPLPLGNWKILAVAKNPPFHYNPDLFWDAKATDEKAKLPPGPNGPVGVVWIDLSKEHYGIHGTPNPETIGRAESHGCVRLTNWDVARLAQMVSGETRVSFVS